MNEARITGLDEYTSEGVLPYKVLDHGYVQLVEHWGSDERIIEAARMSTSKGFEGWEKDAKLLKYLYTNKHMTPFEMAGATFEVMAPIFVFREWHRHRTQSYNEMSARYAPLPNYSYVPTVDRQLQGGGHLTKQAGAVAGAAELDEDSACWFQAQCARLNIDIELTYQEALARGVPKELARIILPVGRYSKMRASANLRNWLQFLTLRIEKTAQWEIRVYANAVCQMLEQIFPRTIKLFCDSL